MRNWLGYAFPLLGSCIGGWFWGMGWAPVVGTLAGVFVYLAVEYIASLMLPRQPSTPSLQRLCSETLLARRPDLEAKMPGTREQHLAYLDNMFDTIVKHSIEVYGDPQGMTFEALHATAEEGAATHGDPLTASVIRAGATVLEEVIRVESRRMAAKHFATAGIKPNS